MGLLLHGSLLTDYFQPETFRLHVFTLLIEKQVSRFLRNTLFYFSKSKATIFPARKLLTAPVISG